ncbi:MAG: ABC transporter permease [Spirochaetes bacterium]|nr:ABC transporter permease [Spirochaetota bacterium]
MKLVKSLIRIISIAEKEWTQIRRDPRSLYISMISPVIFTLLFGYALTVDVKNVSMAVFDQDKTLTSRKFLEEFSHTEYLKINQYVSKYNEIDRLINTEEIKLAIILPRNFEKNFKTGKKVDIQLIADGSDSTSASVAIGYVKAIVANFNIDMKIKELKKIGITETRVPVEARSRVWYNPELQSKNFIIPSLIIMIMTIISALIASLTISREWERGTMETLITTPLRGSELVFGKLLPYLLIGLFDVILMVSIGYFIFNVSIKGNIIELYLLALLFLIGTSSMGMMISSATRSQVLSVQVSLNITFLPTMILSGFIFPVENMPLLIQGITYLVPAKYGIILIRAIVLKGISVLLLWTQIGFLFIFAALAIIISIKKITLRLPE